jgi:pilus assembly protein Flp/PilA
MLEYANLVRSIWFDRRGVTAVEYGIIAALVAVAIIAATTLLGGSVNSTFSNLGTAMQTPAD